MKNRSQETGVRSQNWGHREYWLGFTVPTILTSKFSLLNSWWLLAPLLLLALRVWPHAALRDQVPQSTSVWSSDHELLRVTLASDDQYRLWTPLSEMSPALVEAFQLKEDRWFYWHPGVNPISLIRAGSKTALKRWSGEGRQGGSTLTMQLARMLYHLNTRTVAGKLKQSAIALWLEARYSKRSILEAYLNLVPFGGNVQGVGMASRMYFAKPSSQITLGEAITLAVIPQRPAARAGKGTRDLLLSARTQLTKLWLDANHATDSERRQLELPVLPQEDVPVPMLAPHFTGSVLRANYGHPGKVETTLDAGLQRLVERQVAVYLNQFGDRGIRNMSVLLLDHRDMSVKAWVGSADFGNEEIHGQIDGVLTKRSPGSTLKPFVYALAVDQGVLHPRTILRDSPTSFGPFTPENFDGKFMGPIPAQDALIRSRNIPAVWVSNQLRQPGLYQFLQSAGIGNMRAESYYGLALALGGGEVTSEELAGLYAMLANRGVMQPIRTKPSEPMRPGSRLLSAEASFITVDMLSKNPRPGEDNSLAPRGRWPVAWKTGTSWGFRDAWSAGIAGPYVLVVWIGNFDARGNPSFIGADAAAPLFFRIVDALNLKKSDEPFEFPAPPPGVSKVAVCTESGDLPNHDCPQTIETWYIPGKSPIKVSKLHRAVTINISTGLPACPPYAPGQTRQEVFEFWPSDMMQLFREAGMPRRKAPTIPECAADDSSDIPRIATPLRGVTYSLRQKADRSKMETIALEASTAADVETVFWFDGPSLIAKSAAGHGAIAWRPLSDGIHLIRVIDDHGRAAERDVKVQFLD
ncbi:MAG: penicillin-binding protein 1C [Acidobacteriota bacterium]